MPLQKNLERTPNNEPYLVDDEQVQHVEKGCGVSYSCGEIVPGSLFLTSKRVVWLGQETSKGFAVDYPDIGLHALSRDLNAFPKPCIYCHLQSSEGLCEALGVQQVSCAEWSSDTAAEENEDYTIDQGCEPPGEMRLVPDDDSSLQNIFKVMTDMAALNPDPNQSDSEDESDNFAAMMMSTAPALGENLWNPEEEYYEEDGGDA